MYIILYASKNDITNSTHNAMTVAVVILERTLKASRIAKRVMNIKLKHATMPPFNNSITHKLCAPEPCKWSSFHSTFCIPYPKIGDFRMRSTAFSHITVRLLNVVSLLKVFSIKVVAHFTCSMSLPYQINRRNMPRYRTIKIINSTLGFLNKRLNMM